MFWLWPFVLVALRVLCVLVCGWVVALGSFLWLFVWFDCLVLLDLQFVWFVWLGVWVCWLLLFVYCCGLVVLLFDCGYFVVCWLLCRGLVV